MDGVQVEFDVPEPGAAEVIHYDVAEHYIQDGKITWDDLVETCRTLAQDIWERAWLVGDLINRYLEQEGIKDNSGIVAVCQQLQSDTGLRYNTLYKLAVVSQRITVEERPADFNPTLVYEITAGANGQDDAKDMLDRAIQSGVNSYTQVRRAKDAQAAGIFANGELKTVTYVYYADTNNLYAVAGARQSLVCEFMANGDNLGRYGREEVLRILRANRVETEPAYERVVNG